MPTVCRNCGCAEFTVIDGFFYCASCSEQSQAHRELEVEEDELAADMMAAFNVKLQKKTDKASRKDTNKEPEEITDKVRNLLAAEPDEDYPSVLKHAGKRIATFSTMLGRYCDILIQYFNLQPSVKKWALYLLQMYMKRFKIAFCEEEIDAENPYRQLVKNAQYEILLKEAVEKKKKEKEKLLQSGVNMLSQITSGGLDENLEITQVESELVAHREELSMITEVNTKLSCTAVARLAIIPLYDEILLIMLYTACLLSGYTWILLSDITRWFREGRLPLTILQRVALLPERFYDEELRQVPNSYYSISPTIYPLYEYQRSVFAYSQIANVPLQPIRMNVAQVLSRVCYNLNLPHEFITRVDVVLKMFPPNMVFDEELTHRFGDFDTEKFFDAATSYMRSHILDGFEWRSRGPTPRSMDKTKASILPTVEVKLMAVILFTMKLMFGLDDDREFRMKSCVSDKESFAFPIWLHQLQMRMRVWRGRKLQEVLEKRTKPFENAEEEEGRVFSYMKAFKRPHAPMLIQRGDFVRDPFSFKGCIPNYDVKQEKEYGLSRIFSDDSEKAPDHWDMDSLLAPLHFQATRSKEWYESLCSEALPDVSQVDRYNADVYFKCFDECAMAYEEAEASHTPRKKIKLFEGDEISEDQLACWRQLFPCSSCVALYPRPLYSHLLCRLNRMDDTVFEPLIYAEALDNILKQAKYEFSDTFASLLETFALMIGEEQKVLYAFYLMLEMRFSKKHLLEDFDEIIEDGIEFSTCALVHLSTGPIITLVKLRRLEEDNLQADYRYELIGAKYMQKPVKSNLFEKYGFKTRHLALRQGRPPKRAAACRAAVTLRQIIGIGRQPKKRRLTNVSTSKLVRSSSPEEVSDDYSQVTSEFEEMTLDEGSSQAYSPQSDFSEESDTSGSRRGGSRRSKYGNRKPEKYRLSKKFSKRFAFEFETAFALNIRKYW